MRDNSIVMIVNLFLLLLLLLVLRLLLLGLRVLLLLVLSWRLLVLQLGLIKLFFVEILHLCLVLEPLALGRLLLAHLIKCREVVSRVEFFFLVKNKLANMELTS